MISVQIPQTVLGSRSSYSLGRVLNQRLGEAEYHRPKPVVTLSVELTAHRQVQSAAGKCSGPAQAAHCTGEKTKAQRGASTYPKSHVSEHGTRTQIRIMVPLQLTLLGPLRPCREPTVESVLGIQREGPGWALDEEWPQGAGLQRLQLPPKACPAVVTAAPGCPPRGLKPRPSAWLLRSAVSQVWPMLSACLFPFGNLL